MFRQLRPLTRSALLIPIVTLMLLSVTQAQENIISIPFHHLAQKQGLQDLNNAFVKKDSKGYIWISSFENGLIRYDGRSFTTYKADPTDSTSVAANHITGPCFEDENGNLWFSSYDAINCYVRKRGIFRTYRIRDSEGKELKNFYSAFHLDQQNNLWVRLANGGGSLYRFNTQSKQATFQHQMSGQRFKVVEDENGNVVSVLSTMLLSEGGARLYDYNRSGLLTSEVALLGSGAAQKEVVTYQSYLSGSDPAWVGTSAGLASVSGMRSELPQVEFFPTYKGDSLGFAWSIVPMEDRYLLVSTSRQGLLLFDVELRQFVQRIANDDVDGFNLGAHPLYELYLDRDNILWVTSYNNGLYYGSPSKKKFEVLRSGKPATSIPAIRYLAEAANGDVWSMLPKGKLLRFEADASRMTEIKFPNASFQSLGTPSALFQGQNGKIWLADGGHLFLLQNEILVPIDTIDKPIGSLIELKSGKVLFSSPEQIYVLDPVGPTKYKRAQFPETGSGGEIWFTTAIQDSEGRIYLSLAYNRIAVFQESLEGLEPVVEIENPSHFWGAYDDVEKGDIWFTTPIGLGKLDKRTFQFDRVELDTDLGTCWGLLSDQSRHLWLSNSDGLHRYSMEDGGFHSFTPTDGSFGTGYSRFAYLQRSNGEMWFGGREGISVFHPENVQFISSTPQIHLTSLKVNGKPYRMSDSTLINEVKSFDLGPGQNYLDFEFIALEFSDPTAINYQYKLHRYDRDWVDVGPSTRAIYQKLPPGSYTFSVRATNSDGHWSTPVGFPLMIRPWFYQTIWFRAGMLLLVFAIGLVIYWAQLKRRLQEEAVKNLKELNAFKSRFFTNITHEFRSPLNIILSYLDTALQKNNKLKKGNLEIMQRSGKQLLTLVNQILDLRRLEVAKIQVQYEEIDVLKLTNAVVEDFQKLAYGKGIQLELENDLTDTLMASDREKLRKILSNLVSNAIKFTARGGQVKVQVDQQAGDIRFQVVDNGIGISKDKLPRIFDQFYQAHDENTSKFGSGVGLALSQELAQAMGGEIQVKSKEGIGSTFTLILPVMDRSAAVLEGNIDPIDPTEGMMTASDLSIDPVDPKKDTQALAAQLYLEAVEDREEKQLVLIVEDNPNFRQYIQETLSPYYRTVIRNNGEDGLATAKTLVPDLVVTDVKMPIMDGYELTSALKSDDATCHIPIILLTGLEDIDARVKGIQKGADIYLNKPFHEQELLSWIQNLLRLREKLQSIYRGLGASVSDEPQEQHEPNDPDREFIQKVKLAIDTNFHKESFSVKKLSKMMNMEYVTFYRKFKAITSENAKKTIQDKRIGKAKYLLLNEPSKRIREIAFEVGFSDPGYFAKVFKEVEGLTPKQFRERKSSKQ